MHKNEVKLMKKITCPYCGAYEQNKEFCEYCRRRLFEKNYDFVALYGDGEFIENQIVPESERWTMTDEVKKLMEQAL